MKHPILHLRALADKGNLDRAYKDNSAKSGAQAMAILLTWNLFIADRVGSPTKVIWRKEDGVPKIL